MKILITGGNGFVGGYLAARLASERHEVVLTDLACELSRVPAPSEPSLPYLCCDLTDEAEVSSLIAGVSPDAIVHLAAQSSAAVSFTDPRLTFEVNVIGTLNLLEAAKKHAEGARILLTGSCEEYGKRTEIEMPLGEDSPIEPVSPYAASKAAQGTMGLQYHRAYGSRVMITRSFSHTGPGQKETFVLPSFARQCASAARGIGKLVIKTGNIAVVRDFLDVRDVARAYAALLEKGVEGRTYNVCSGKGLDLGHALDRLRSMAGVEITVETDPALLRPVDVPVLIGDNLRITGDTGWSPEIDSEGMLRDLYDWWLERIG